MSDQGLARKEQAAGDGNWSGLAHLAFIDATM
jgi:hypothetical protein